MSGALFWSPADEGRAVQALTRATGLAAPGAAVLHGVRCDAAALSELVRGAGPALLVRHRPGGGHELLVVLGPAGPLGRVRVLTPGGQVRRVPAAALAEQLQEGPAVAHTAELDSLLDAAGLQGRPRARARARLLGDRLRGQAIAAGSLLRASPQAPWLAQAREAGVLGPLALALLTRAAGTGVSLTGWALIGGGVLSGRVAPSWVLGWALILLTGLVLGRCSELLQGRLALRWGTWLKQALLHGALRMDPEEGRRDGPGGVMARVQESQAIEDLVLSGGLGALLAVVDLLTAGWVLSQAPQGLPLVALLAGVAGVVVGGALRQRALQGRWTEARRALTQLTVERMVGHRTRLAQGVPARWNEGEDAALEAATTTGLALDRHRIALGGVLSAGFQLPALAVLGLGVALTPQAPAALALALGGLLWAQGALMGVSMSLNGLVAAAISWREVGGLLRQARAGQAEGDPTVQPAPTPAGQLLVRAQGLGFAWPGRPPVLQGVQLELRQGDRALLTGASGGGKTTLLMLLAGLRAPTEGLLLLGGLDRSVLGPSRWRARAVAAPQFHDNHVFENTLGFNLLLGREWPASGPELDEARALCEELGLGELLQQMPAGLGQPVGASGWQLSHGERSRVYLARALLQGAELVLLDESFAALDPGTLRRCLEVAERRARTLVVIAHP